jgi:DNA polymerase-3 subunit delta'
MNGFGDIVGQDAAVSRLRRALANRTPHHAYLFDGPAGVGKRATALALAQAWNCERRPGEGCGACEPCRKIDRGLHPDLLAFQLFVEEEGKLKVKGQTERMRELIAALGFPPHEGRARVVLIDPADALIEQASNVLLKTLEEPPAGTHFVLVSAMASSLLATVRSRCHRVVFTALPDETVVRLLVDRHGVDEAAARTAARLAAGSVGRALALATGEDLTERQARAGQLVAAAKSREAGAVLDAAGKLAGNRVEAEATLELLWLTYREALLAAEGVAVTGSTTATALATIPPRSLIVGLRAIEEAQDAVRGFVSPQLAVEQLLFRIGDTGAV